MSSLQRELITRVLIATLALSAAALTGVFLYARHAVIDEFDAATVGKARAFPALVELEPAGQVEVEFSEASLPEYYTASPDRFFEVRRADGSILASSPQLKNKALLPAGVTPGEGEGFDVPLPNGHRGRGIVMHFGAWAETPRPGEVRAAPAKQEVFTLVLARERVVLDRVLSRLASGLMLAGVLLAGATTLAVVAVVRRSLRPVQAVARQAGEIDADSLDKRLPIDGLAAELRPICQCINELLARVEAGFKRERQFTANVAHELRTPIAELRAMAEVALAAAARNGAAPDPNDQDALDIALQMQATVTSLLGLARCHAGTQAAAFAPVDLAELVNTTWRRFAPKAAARGVRAEVEITAAAIIVSDRALLSSILDNLFSNATEYVRTDGDVHCRIEQDDGGVRLAISNTTVNLHADDVARMCEPFWRKDAVRSSAQSVHAGLGLALVEAYARVLRIDLKLGLASENVFAATLSFAKNSTLTDLTRAAADRAPARRIHDPLAAAEPA